MESAGAEDRSARELTFAFPAFLFALTISSSFFCFFAAWYSSLVAVALRILCTLLLKPPNSSLPPKEFNLSLGLALRGLFFVGSARRGVEEVEGAE